MNDMKDAGKNGSSGTMMEQWIAQEVFRHPEQLAASFMNAPNVGVAISDTQFRFRGVNEALAAMNGLPAAEHFGQTVGDILGSLSEKIEPLFHRVLATGEPVLNVHVTGTLSMRAEPGHWIENYFPLKDSHGSVTRLCSMVVEITEQKKLEESLRLLATVERTEKDQLKSLLEFHSHLVTKPDFGEFVAAITTFVNRVIPHDYATLTLEGEAAQWLQMDSPNPAGVVLAHGVPLPITLTKQINRGKQSSKLQAGSWDQMLGPEIQSVYNMPLATTRAVLGTLHLASRKRGAFETLERELAERVAMHVGLALDYACVSKEIASLKNRLAEQTVGVEPDGEQDEEFSEILGESSALRQILKQARTVAKTDATVLILGETGTGKDLLARAIHRMSRRKEQNFVKINCVAIPTGLLESELFGHEKGAFTGASMQKIGRLELADGGTLLLDEIGDLPLELQPKLLRVLQDGEFERLGGTRTIRVNVRLIAATNRDLNRKVAEGRFRSDLFYRLNVFPVCMPALRDRKEDIPLLTRHFVRKFSRIMEKNIETIPNELMDELQNWDWPGNVRELEHFVERAAILTPGKVLRGSLPELHEASSGTVERTLAAMEREYILGVLRETRGKVSGIDGAAAKLGLKRTTLQSKMRKLKLERLNYRQLSPTKRT